MDSLSLYRSITRRIVAATSKYTMPSPPVFFGPLPSPAPSRKPPSLLSHFIDAVTALFNINNNLVLEEEEAAVPKPKPKPQPQMRPMETLTRYSLSSGNPCVDLFNMLFQYHDTPSPPETLRELLRRAWAHNPLTTLKLILRRGNPSDMCSDIEIFYTVVFWLHQNHPKTLALNVRWFEEFNYMIYLLEILFREVARPDVLEIEEEKSELVRIGSSYLRRRGLKRIFAQEERLRPELARRFLERYNSDSNYRFLYDRISDFFAESLRTDIGYFKSGEFWKIGHAAIRCWALDSLLDYSTLLRESIAKRVFPRESNPSYAQMDEAALLLHSLQEAVEEDS
ncbi:Thioredoxin-like protein [Cinnamomum micranthum f. kanehirae]|uniref:Thioredoxin-like protein n=1 Tax=Cinnamomum micranthum f. kanehirae TaxID=337451 RepID=A0A3S3NFV7_9MAGN|nr:Thioredoxin-like protein [Cinnamomum micranthum f. kanehirae]